jgi:hypothetical protein
MAPTPDHAGMDVTYHGTAAGAAHLARMLRDEGLHVVYRAPDDSIDHDIRVIVLAVFGEATDASLHYVVQRAVNEFTAAYPAAQANLPPFRQRSQSSP